MGLDDLGVLKLVLPLLALLLTLFVSGPATILSYGAWKWSRSELVKGHGLQAPRVASVLALVVTGLPAAYAIWLLVLLLLAFPGHLGVAAMLPVLAIVLLALVHAAFRAESIREIAENLELAENLSRLPDVAVREAWLSDAGRAALPSFAGTTKRRALKRAAKVALAWVVPMLLLLLVGR
jgi:hypothetical protein